MSDAFGRIVTYDVVFRIPVRVKSNSLNVERDAIEALKTFRWEHDLVAGMVDDVSIVDSDLSGDAEFGHETQSRLIANSPTGKVYRGSE